MTDEKALLAAIWEHPHDDAPRLVYADWLQENGQPERAEFIRLQIEHTQLDEDSPRSQQVQKTIESLLRVWDKKWRKKFSGTKKEWPWRRGFIQPDDRGIEAKKLFKMPAKAFTVAPCRSFVLIDDLVPLKALVAWPHLHRLNTFSLRERQPRGNWLKLVEGCDGFRNVSRIFLVSTPISVPKLEQLLNIFRKQRIDELCLNGCRIGDDGFRMLLNHPMIPTLRALEFNDIDLTAAGVKSLAESTYHPPKPSLDLSLNPVGDDGVKELVRWKGLGRIKDLSLDFAEIGDAGVAALAKCRGVGSVETLALQGNQIGVAGVEALIASKHFASLTHLSIALDSIPGETQKKLRARYKKAEIG